jgi:hypothetical protein
MKEAPLPCRPAFAGMPTAYVPTPANSATMSVPVATKPVPVVLKRNMTPPPPCI